MKNILKKYNLSLILLHGSCATGKTHKKSDVDIAVLQKNRKDNLNLPSLYGALTKKYNSDKVDIVNLTYANPLLTSLVARKSKLVAGKRVDYEKFLRLAFHKYSDYKPYLQKEAEFVKERIDSYANS